MISDTPFPRRKSMRLPNYDYSQPGAYFVTLLTHQRQPFLCDIIHGRTCYSKFGTVVKDSLLDLPKYHSNLMLDEFCIMPDHLHAIIRLVEVCKGGSTDNSQHVMRPAETRPNNPTSLIEIIRAYKSFTSRKINAIHGTAGTSAWHRSYYEHVIRDEAELNQIRNYIVENPLKWELEKEGNR